MKIHLYLFIVMGVLLVGCRGSAPVETTVLRGSIAGYSILFEGLSGVPKVEEHGVMVGMIDGDDVTVAVIGNNTFTEDTLFQYGSVTKIITANVLGQLAVEGLVDLHGPLNDHLPASFQSAQWEKITIMQLASHVGGVPRMPPGLNGAPDNVRDFDRDALAASMSSTFVNNNGDLALYSNYGYVILGLVIEEATGMSYAEVVQARIFDPLGMETASMHGWASDDVAPALNANGNPTEIIDFDAAAAGGALRGSVADMLAFLEASIHACDGTDIVAQGACLAQDSTLRPSDKPTASWGLGWQFLTTARLAMGGKFKGDRRLLLYQLRKKKPL